MYLLISVAFSIRFLQAQEKQEHFAKIDLFECEHFIHCCFQNRINGALIIFIQIFLKAFSDGFNKNTHFCILTQEVA